MSNNLNKKKNISTNTFDDSKNDQIHDYETAAIAEYIDDDSFIQDVNKDGKSSNQNGHKNRKNGMIMSDGSDKDDVMMDKDKEYNEFVAANKIIPNWTIPAAYLQLMHQKELEQKKTLDQQEQSPKLKIDNSNGIGNDNDNDNDNDTDDTGIKNNEDDTSHDEYTWTQYESAITTENHTANQVLHVLPEDLSQEFAALLSQNKNIFQQEHKQKDISPLSGSINNTDTNTNTIDKEYIVSLVPQLHSDSTNHISNTSNQSQQSSSLSALSAFLQAPPIYVQSSAVYLSPDLKYSCNIESFEKYMTDFTHIEQLLQKLKKKKIVSKSISESKSELVSESELESTSSLTFASTNLDLEHPDTNCELYELAKGIFPSITIHDIAFPPFLELSTQIERLWSEIYEKEEKRGKEERCDKENESITITDRATDTANMEKNTISFPIDTLCLGSEVTDTLLEKISLVNSGFIDPRNININSNVPDYDLGLDLDLDLDAPGIRYLISIRVGKVAEDYNKLIDTETETEADAEIETGRGKGRDRNASSTDTNHTNTTPYLYTPWIPDTSSHIWRKLLKQYTSYTSDSSDTSDTHKSHESHATTSTNNLADVNIHGFNKTNEENEKDETQVGRDDRDGKNNTSFIPNPTVRIFFWKENVNNGKVTDADIEVDVENMKNTTIDTTNAASTNFSPSETVEEMESRLRKQFQQDLLIAKEEAIYTMAKKQALKAKKMNKSSSSTRQSRKPTKSGVKSGVKKNNIMTDAVANTIDTTTTPAADEENVKVGDRIDDDDDNDDNEDDIYDEEEFEKEMWGSAYSLASMSHHINKDTNTANTANTTNMKNMDPNIDTNSIATTMNRLWDIDGDVAIENQQTMENNSSSSSSSNSTNSLAQQGECIIM